MPLAAGTTLGPYAVVSFVGAGGMGEIYKARDTRLDRTVALKVHPRGPDGSVIAVEIRAGASVEPGIPKALFKVPLNTFETENAINYAVTRDGQKFVVLTDSRSQSTEPMTAILNWTSLLKK
jgi:serine/threonine protein kinase